MTIACTSLVLSIAGRLRCGGGIPCAASQGSSVTSARLALVRNRRRPARSQSHQSGSDERDKWWHPNLPASATYWVIFLKAHGPFPHPCFVCGGEVDGHTIPRDTSAAVLHHIDHNCRNNDPTNLAPAHSGVPRAVSHEGVLRTAGRPSASRRRQERVSEHVYKPSCNRVGVAVRPLRAVLVWVNATLRADGSSRVRDKGPPMADPPWK